MLFFANPYSYNLTGFYFSSESEYWGKLAIAKTNQCDDFEHEIEVIEADRKFFKYTGSDIRTYFQFIDMWEAMDVYQQAIFTHLIEYIGYDFAQAIMKKDNVNYSTESLSDTAKAYAEESLYLTGVALQYFDAEMYSRDMQLNSEWYYVYLGQDTHLVMTNLDSLN